MFFTPCMHKPSGPATRVVRFEPRCLRDAQRERRLTEHLTEWLSGQHPAWPLPLVEKEARRLAREIVEAERR